MSALAHPWRLSRRPNFRIGWRDDEPTFENIWTGRFTPRGSVVVGDQTGSAYWEISLDGEILEARGRSGDGPGEFRGVQSVLPVGDSIFVQSDMTDRISVFSEVGFSRSMRIGAPSSEIFALTVSGQLLFRPSSWPRVVDPANRWVDAAVFRIPPQGGVPDTVLTYPMFRTWSGEWTYDPFEPFGWVAASSDHIVYARSDVPEVRWYNHEGTLEQIARWEQADRVRVTAETWEAYSRSYQGLSSPEIDPKRTDRMLRDLRPTASRSLPLFKRVFAGRDGSIWLAEYTIGWEEPSRFFVMDETGRWVGYVDVPDRFTLLDVSRDAVLGVEKDDWDIQAVSVYLIRR
jgi:hypothetical protein